MAEAPAVAVSAEVEGGPDRKAVTLRSVLLAGGLAVGVNVVVNYVEYVVHASRMTLSHFPMGTLLPYLLLALGLNPLFRLLSRRFALSSTELLVVLAGGLVGGAIPSVGLTGYFLGAVAAPFYFATPENQWGEFFHPYIPHWLAPRNTNGTLNHLFEGLPPGDAIPWNAWLVPVVCWMGLITALFFGSVCLAVILRKQWVESERISFPILRPVTELTERARALQFPRLFWIGFAVAFGILAWNMINYFVPGFPQIPNIRWGPWIRFERYFPGLWTRINMFTISFCYFANIDVLFSLWFFDLLFIIRSGILNRLGYNASSWSHASGDFQWLPLGAFFAMVGWGFWTSRNHLRLVFMKAIGREAPLDERDEMMSFRTAVFGLAACVLFAVFWWWQAGMSLVLACAFVLAAFVLYLGVARIVSDVGLVFISMPVGPQRFVTSLFGSRNLSGSSLTTLAFTNGVASYGKGLFMPSVIHGTKLADVCPRDGRRRVLAALLLAFGLGCIFSVVFTLYLGYTYGAYNFNDWPFTRYSKSGFGRVLTQMNNPEPPHRLQLSLFGIGAGVMSLLTFLKYRFPWWPFHPVGFALAGTGTSVRYTVFSVFLAWAIKFLILRIGGAALYRRYVPFFLGVLVGYSTGVGVSLIVDMVWFPGGGHSIHGY